MEQTGFPEKIRRHRGEVLLCILALVLLLPNVMNLFVYNVESAEAFSVKMGNMTLSEMLYATSNEIHPPLYYALLHVWIALFGNAGAAYRFLSLIPYLLTMGYAFVFLRKEFGYCCAAVFMTCTSLVTTALRFNTHIRNYSWPAFFVLLCYHELYLILRDGKKKDYILLAVFADLAGYLLYYALLPAGLCYLFLLGALLLGKRKAEIRQWMLSALLAIVIYAPWLVVFFRTLQSLGGWYWLQEVEPFSEFYKVIFSARFSALWPSVWLLLAAYLVYRESKKEAENPGAGKFPADLQWILAGVFVVFGTIAVGLLVSALVRPLFNQRYLYPASPLAWLSLAAAVEKLKRKKVIVPVCLALFIVLQLHAFSQMWIRRREWDRQTMATVQAVTARGVEGATLLSDYPLGGYDDEIILHMGFLPSPMTEYYFRGIADEIRLDPADPASWELEDNVRYFLFAEKDLSTQQLRTAEDLGYRMERLAEDARVLYNYEAVYYVEKNKGGRQK